MLLLNDAVSGWHLSAWFLPASTFVLAVGTLIVGVWHLRERTALHRRQLAFDEKRHEDALVEERRAAEFRRAEQRRFEDTGRELAQHLSRALADDPTWARQALEASKLLPYAHTLFGERSQHFKEEKELLAKRFVPMLLERCRRLIESKEDKRDVYLIIDAGTTLFPFFEQIGKLTAKAASQTGKKGKWLKHLHLVTNNLPGMEQLMQVGRLSPFDRYSPLAIQDSRLLPGIPIPIFGAVAGKQTQEAVDQLKSEKPSGDREAYFISLIVGNWIRIRRKGGACPVPMARGKEHREVKNAVVNGADEIYVVSPLGKVFLECSEERVNQILGFEDDRADQDRTPYGDVAISEELSKRVRIVSTDRAKERLLLGHAKRLGAVLGHCSGDCRDFPSLPMKEVPHLLFPFDKLPQTSLAEREAEFPHYHTRNNAGFLEQFHVDPISGPGAS